MRRSRLVIGAVALWTLGAAFSAPGAEASKKIVRVTQEGSGIESERDGSSWERALGEGEFAKRLKEAAAETEFWVAKGRYRPSLSGDAQASFELGEGVAVYGGFRGGENTRDERDPDVNVTILTGDLDNDDVKDTSGITLSWRDIKGNNSAAVIRSKKCTEKAVLDGFTVTGGDGPKDGGGMYNLSSSPRISRCTFVGNRAQANGGGMANRESSPIVENCTFERNRAGKGGGGMFNFGRIGKTKDFVPVVEGCVFSENSSELHGGGMSSMAASPRVADSSFVGNVVSSDTNKDVRGGALYFYYDAQGEVTNSSFVGNTASTTHPKSRGLGGGIAVLERSHVTLSGCTFSQNRSTHCGGGFFQSVGSPIFTNCTFFRNESSKGGGLYAENGGTSIPPTAPILAHCTFFKNAADEGGALYAAQEVRPAILNGVLWENDGGEIGYHDKVGSFLVTHCVIRGNYVIPRGGVFEDIVSADAKLLPLAGNGGRTETCALQTGSSAIDSGMNGLQMAAWLRKSLRLPEQRIGWLLSCVSADQRGLKRSGAPDAGAYESNATVPGDSFVISAAADVGGSIRPSGEISVRRGEDQAFAVSADKGFRIASIRIDGAPLSLDADGTYVYTFRDVSADHSILAGFEEICFTKLEVVGDPVVRVRVGEICSFGFRLVGDAGVETVRNVSAEYRNKAGLPLSGEKWSWFVKLPVTSVDIPMTFKPKAGIEDGTLTLNVTLRNGSLLSASLSLTVLSGDVPQPQPQPRPEPDRPQPQPQPRPEPDRPQPQPKPQPEAPGVVIPDQSDAWHVKVGAPDASGVSPVELSCLLELPSSPVSIHAETSHFVDGIESYGISKVSGTAGVSTYTQTGGSRKYHLRLRGRILSSDMDRATLKALSLKLENGTEIRKTLGNGGLKVQDIPRTAPAKEGTGGGCNSPSLGGSCLALVSLLRRIRSRMSHSANRS